MEEKVFSNKIFEMYEEEKRHISRELHDGAGQYLYAILITINSLEKETGTDKIDAGLKTIKMLTKNAMQEIKDIAQTLRPRTLDDLGLIPALRSYLETYKQVYGIPVTFEISGEVGRLSPEIETSLYRISQEALTNSAKYAKASLIQVSIILEEDTILLMLKDNGTGFNIEDYETTRTKKGIGLFSIKERAEGLGGSASINSETSLGTTIRIQIPRH